MPSERKTRLLPAAAALALALGGCGPMADVEVEQARVLLPVLHGRPAALYFIATSKSGNGRLASITSRRAERIELHETRTQSGVTRMMKLPSVGFDDINEMEFRPGGKHAMVLGLDREIEAGDKLPLTFNFEPGPKLQVEADVLAFGDGHGEH